MQDGLMKINKLANREKHVIFIKQKDEIKKYKN